MQFVHTNIVARDWKRLAHFYQQVFGCTPVPPERDLSGTWLDRLTGVAAARVHGVHLRLPGHGEHGPTLEVFQYNHQREAPQPAVNRPGLAHLAFAVGDVDAVRGSVLAAGGGLVGEVVTVDISGVGGLRLAYVTDPEGNIIELQQRGGALPSAPA